MKTMYSIAILLLLVGTEPVQAFQQRSADTLTVEVRGTGADARFVPALLKVSRGDVIRFEVLEGMHTVTAYHPDNRRPLRMPESISSFDSGMLNEGDVWFLEITKEGIYDYFCLPHERLGHVGRIVAGDNAASGEYDDSVIPEAAAQTFQSL
ncbi:cupredoxin domain-containing protein [Gracilimonas sediminicola]|uniref:Plastocyanin/azurin family copper-binding protein n=1 Tax=Gracilimonas sediminicola TaxID=2952158 RepID=A0A9X2RCR0_9BACT|nr:plastocyanin/azurin family copper-binding protein [Gracilimonas sediminicola]MCP9290112.1 plastocyanin/azurin family copper-binding protein [Gracilimonas sediminicola]